MIASPIIPFALPRATLTLTRPVARMLATLVFPLSRFPANLINTRASRAYRALARRPRLCRLSERSSHKAQGSRSAIPRRWKSVSRMPRKEWYNG